MSSDLLIPAAIIIAYVLGRFAREKCSCPSPSPFSTCIVFINNHKISGENLMIKVPFNTASLAGAFPGPVDANNNAATVQEGSLQIASTDDSIGTVEGDPDDADNPYAFKVNFTGKAGAMQVTISADADLGEGVKTITGALTIEVPAGEAVGFGEAVLKEPVPKA